MLLLQKGKEGCEHPLCWVALRTASQVAIPAAGLLILPISATSAPLEAAFPVLGDGTCHL